MNTRRRRYIFVDFENLKKVKFKKLEKVCDKVFILIQADAEFIPISMVQQMQRLGKGVKWIVVHDTQEEGLNYHICFLLGKLHQKVSSDVEFAILSNDKAFDPLVNFINAEGRSCLRVKRKKTKEEKEDEWYSAEESSELLDNLPGSTDYSPQIFLSDVSIDSTIIEETAKETVERLMRSGNRPSELEMLRNYILLHNQELSEHGNVDMIIQSLEASDDIKIEKGEVIYNF
ncbi:MAG: PIN domain-containing protein [Bacteroidota bacterium]